MAGVFETARAHHSIIIQRGIQRSLIIYENVLLRTNDRIIIIEIITSAYQSVFFLIVYHLFLALLYILLSSYLVFLVLIFFLFSASPLDIFHGYFS